MEPSSAAPDGVLAQREAMWKSGELQHVFAQKILEPEALEAIRQFANSPLMKSIQVGLQQLQTLALNFDSFLKRPEVISGIETFVKRINELSLSPQTQELFKSITAIKQTLDGSPLANYLASASSVQIEELLDEATDLPTPSIPQSRAEIRQQVEIEREIVEHFERGGLASALSKWQRSHLLWILMVLTALANYISMQNGAREEICFWQPKLAPGLTHSQIGKSYRAMMCESELPLHFLRDFRTVKGLGVHLRSAPSRKALVIDLPIPDGTLLQILDSSNRDWLHVSVVNEEGVEGWISRKYTRRLLR